MATHRARDLSVGVTSALALAILAFAAMSVGDGFSFFSERTNFVIVFDESDGLVQGSPVKIAGVTVGTVNSIELPTNPEDSGIHVKIGVDPKYAERIREDSVAALRLLQIVSGEKYVDVSPGNSTLPPLKEGTTIPTATSSELFEQGADIAGNLQQITASFNTILEPIVRGEGLLGELVNDPNFGKDGLAKFKGTLENLEAVTEQVSQGRGFVAGCSTTKNLRGRSIGCRVPSHDLIN